MELSSVVVQGRLFKKINCRIVFEKLEINFRCVNCQRHDLHVKGRIEEKSCHSYLKEVDIFHSCLKIGR